MPPSVAIQEEEYTGRFNLGVWRQVYKYVLVYPGLVARLAALGVFMALMHVAFPVLTWAIIREAKLHGLDGRLWEYGIGYFAAVVVWSAAVGVFIRTAGRLSTHVSHDIRRKAFEHLQALSFSYYDRREAGWVVARLTSDCDRLARTISWGFLDLIWGPTLITGITIAMFVIDAKLATVMLIVLPPLAVASLAFQKWILRASRAVRKQNSTITAAYSECIQGVRTTKTLVREEENLEEFRGRTGLMYRHSVRSAVLSNTYMPIVFTLGSIGTGLALWAGGHDVIAGAIGIQTLIFFMLCAREFIFPMMDLSQVFAELQTAQAAAERVLGLIGTEPDVKDSAEALEAIRGHAEARRVQAGRGAVAEDGLPDRIDTLEFRNVSFEYESDQPVLHDFDLTVRSGQTIALVGPTGGGKTTIVSLVGRFYEPTAGRILIDGVDYRRRSLHWLQSGLGIVLQEPHLFSGTVRENIRYGRLSASDREIERAAGVVHAHDFIIGLENGYETQVGEGGGRLSTGQKQLVSFARAVLADPRILIMDEATSSVDTETEQLIQRGLAAVLAGRISFIVAHRLSTIRSADRILVVDGGRVIEQGSHADLIVRRGRYYRLYTNQFAEQRTSELLGRGEDVVE